MKVWLVVWNMFFSIYGIILPIDELIFFKVVKNTNQKVIVTYVPHKAVAEVSE
jgi:hypothetical protein